MTDVEVREGLVAGSLSVVNADHLRRLTRRNDERQTEIAQLRAALRETRECLRWVICAHHVECSESKAVLARHAHLAGHLNAKEMALKVHAETEAAIREDRRQEAARAGEAEHD